MAPGSRSLCLLALLAGCGVRADQRPYFVDEAMPRPPWLPSTTVRRPYYVASPTVLFLQLEGAQISLGSLSDAPTNQSYVCGATIPAWDSTPFGTDRAAVVEQLRQKVLELFADFNLEVVTARPATPPYDMVVVGGTASLCGRPDGLGGVGPLDCGNLDYSDVAFVFGATITALDGLAVAIAHESGHTWGLPHTTDSCDVMSSAWCTGGNKRFLDAPMSVPPDPTGNCGLQTSNSWYRLLEVLGPRPAPLADVSPGADLPPRHEARLPDDGGSPRPESAVPSSGCAVARDRGSPRAASLILLVPLAVFVLVLLPRRAAGHRETANGHPRRDQLCDR